MRKVACIHLYNDFSGSPAVLANVINGFVNDGIETTLITNKSHGKLSNINNVIYNKFYYQYFDSTILRLLSFLFAQLQIFIKVFFLSKDHTIYINTVLPFGAALAASVSNKNVVYHIHETSLKPKLLKYFLFTVANKTANKAIYVSKFVAKKEAIRNVRSKVIYNALPKKQAERLNEINADFNQHPNILMICSLKDYKGIPEFIELAKQLTNYSFTLVCNASEKEVMQYCRGKIVPLNLVIFSKQTDIVMFYKIASVVVNLSRKNEWIETFGLTLLEAMQAGIPVIGQTIGGNSEILENGKYGYCIDGSDIENLKKCIGMLLENRKIYNEMSALSKERAALFNIDKQISEILGFIFGSTREKTTEKTMYKIA